MDYFIGGSSSHIGGIGGEWSASGLADGSEAIPAIKTNKTLLTGFS